MMASGILQELSIIDALGPWQHFQAGNCLCLQVHHRGIAFAVIQKTTNLGITPPLSVANLLSANLQSFELFCIARASNKWPFHHLSHRILSSPLRLMGPFILSALLWSFMQLTLTFNIWLTDQETISALKVSFKLPKPLVKNSIFVISC